MTLPRLSLNLGSDTTLYHPSGRLTVHPEESGLPCNPRCYRHTQNRFYHSPWQTPLQVHRLKGTYSTPPVTHFEIRCKIYIYIHRFLQSKCPKSLPNGQHKFKVIQVPTNQDRSLPWLQKIFTQKGLNPYRPAVQPAYTIWEYVGPVNSPQTRCHSPSYHVIWSRKREVTTTIDHSS